MRASNMLVAKWNWHWVCYYGGLLSLVLAVLWWLTAMFKLFASFYQHNFIELIIYPVVDFIVNPFLWLSLILFKLSQWKHKTITQT